MIAPVSATTPPPPTDESVAAVLERLRAGVRQRQAELACLDEQSADLPAFLANVRRDANLAEPSIRASAQALFGVVVYGLGMYLGTEASGWLNQRFTRETAPAVDGEPPRRTTDWRRFWLVPAIVVGLSLAAFLASLFLIPEPAAPEVDPAAAAEEVPAELP